MSKVYALGAKVMCNNVVGLVGTQRTLCRENPEVMTSIGKGAKLGLEQCQKQFSQDRWNCSTFEQDTSVFGKLMRRSNKETAFVHAITSAGVVYEVTRACSRGELRECNCDRKNEKTSENDGFQWGGCSENVGYGIQFARTFIDSRETQQDPPALMNLHNNKVGRKAVRRLMELQCKCHGVSGSCAVKSCWKQMMPFETVGNLLRRKYLNAIKVTVDQAGKSLSKVNKRKKPSGEAMVFLENSPDYCRKDDATGSPGTGGRECNKTRDGVGSCAALCCGRGFDTIEMDDESKCDCQFHWCCYVKCKDCHYKVDKNFCKAPPKAESSRPRPRGKRDGRRRFEIQNNVLKNHVVI
ncbi:protein Wnt-2b-A-like isoform X2 [Dendronephthya gigantea]|nr:protein Wnt-2b-A-like isoform X2 [Dendronephthya gigantea]